MGDGLPGVFAAIGYDTETCRGQSRPIRDVSRRPKQAGEKRVFKITGLKQILSVPLWNHYNMNRRLRLDIVKGDDQVILVYNFCRYLPPNNFAEDAIVQRESPHFIVFMDKTF